MADTSSKHDKHRVAESIQWWQKIIKTIRHKPWISILLFLLIVVLGLGYRNRWAKGFSFDSLWEWIDPVAGIGSFVITLVILYNQGFEMWKNSLEKRLTVNYITNSSSGSRTIARVEGAYLAGESDIRQWAQQLGKQMFGGDLAFDMNWDEIEAGKIKKQGKEYYVNYEINLYLSQNPLSDENGGKAALNKFLERKADLKHSEVIEGPKIIWKRK